MSEMIELCDFFKKRGYEPLSIPNYHVQVFRKGSILVRITEKQENNDLDKR